jgi:amino acid permease
VHNSLIHDEIQTPIIMPPQESKQTSVISQESLFTIFKRNESLEFLNPPSDSPLRRTNLFFGTFNLVATIVGGGVLSVPLAFAKAGIVLATLMMIFSAVITDFSLYILCSCARRTGSATYMDIVSAAFGPRAELFMTGILWVFLSGVLVAFNVLLKGIFAPLARDIVSTYSLLNLDTDTFVGRQFDSLVLLWIILLVSPLMLKRNLYALRHICYVGFTSVCVIMISIGVRAFQRNQSIEQGHIPAGLIGDNVQIKYFTDSWTDALFAFPIIVLAFLCSYNMVEVHGVGSVLKQISYLSLFN